MSWLWIHGEHCISKGGSPSQAASLSRSSWRVVWFCIDVISLYTMQSAANILVLELRSSGRSLIKTKNDAGPRTEP